MIGCFAYKINSFFPIMMVHPRRWCFKLNEEQPILVH